MTANKDLKRLVRARAKMTGESYAAALRHFRKEAAEGQHMADGTHPADAAHPREPTRPALRRVEKPELGFALQLPVEWVEEPPDPLGSPDEMARFRGPANPGEGRGGGGGGTQTCVVYRRAFSAATQAALRAGELVAHGLAVKSLMRLHRLWLARHGYANFRLSGARIADRAAARLDCDRKWARGAWTKREYFVLAGDHGYSLSLGSANRDRDQALMDTLAAGFELMEPRATAPSRAEGLEGVEAPTLANRQEARGRIRLDSQTRQRVEAYSIRARRVLAAAHENAIKRGHSAIGQEQLLLGIAMVPGSAALVVLEDLGISSARLGAASEAALPAAAASGHHAAGGQPPTKLQFSARAEAALDLAEEEARAPARDRRRRGLADRTPSPERGTGLRSALITRRTPGYVPRRAATALWLRATAGGVIRRFAARRSGPEAWVHSYAHRVHHASPSSALLLWPNGGQEADLLRLAGWCSRTMLGRYRASVAEARAREAHRPLPFRPPSARGRWAPHPSMRHYDSMAGDPTADALAIIRSIDWSRLAHAYGPAHDTPAYLVALASSTDAETPSDALSHLWGAVLHQGSLYSSTPATARVVAALLADSRTTDPVARWADLGEDPLPLRATLLDFLAAFAESCFVDSPDDLEAMAHLPGREAELAQLEAGWPDDDEEPPDEALLDALYARVTLASRAQCPHLLDAVVPLLADPLPAVRLRAANCIAKLRQHADLAAQRAALLAEIERAARAGGTEERAALVLSLGELGADTSPFLADAHPAVRCCAALVPSQTDKPAATCEILAALLDPAAADHWLPRVPQLKGWLRFTLLREAIRRTCSFEELLPTALAIARGSASVHTVESDWGPLLAAAFPAPPQGPLSPAQHAYLAALVANERLWDPRNGNAHLWFKRLGLPYDRDACRSLLRGSG